MINRILLTYSVFLCCFSICEGQQKNPADSFRVVNRELSIKNSDGSAPVVHLNAASEVGIAWINGRRLKEGTIEFDEKGKDVLQQSFVGFAFHGVDDKNYEAIYFRPFNFRSTDSVRKLHAVQYIASPGYDWPLLRSKFPNQYEKPIIPPPDPNEWFHVKIEVKDNKIRVFVNNNSVPALEVTALVKLDGQMVGYWVGNGSEGDWKNLNIR